MTNKRPVILKPGDIVDVIAPSFTSSGEMEFILSRVKELLGSIGLIPRIADGLIDRSKDLFCANSLEYRKNHLIDCLRSKESKAIWALRGGYGAAQLIPFLEEICPPETPKFIIGFSDITALHLFVLKKWNWQTLHAAVLNQVITNPNLLLPIKDIIFSNKEFVYTGFKLINQALLEENLMVAEIVGGNCSLVQTSIGTSWQIEAKRKILFLEDVGERGYKIHRMLNHFKQAGVLDGVKAIIFGIFNDGAERDGFDLCIAALEDFAKQITIPVLYFPHIGHDANNNLPLPLGVEVILNFAEQITLKIPKI